MHNDGDERRLFFGFGVEAPWPKSYPRGRIIPDSMRHMTLAFMADASPEKLMQLKFPLPDLKRGLAGYFDEPIFLPPKHPRVVSWHPKMSHLRQVAAYQQKLTEWLQLMGYEPDHPDRPWLGHVTVARGPFDIDQWRRQFQCLPFLSTHLNLYESVGNLRYEVLASHTLPPPFEEIPHTADIAFRIYGNSLEEIFERALLALAFRVPDLLMYRAPADPLESVEDIVRHLNRSITLMDVKQGCPLKSVSFSGEVKLLEEELIWEMIVDV